MIKFREKGRVTELTFGDLAEGDIFRYRAGAFPTSPRRKWLGKAQDLNDGEQHPCGNGVQVVRLTPADLEIVDE